MSVLDDVLQACKDVDCIIHVASFGMSGRDMVQYRILEDSITIAQYRTVEGSLSIIQYYNTYYSTMQYT